MAEQLKLTNTIRDGIELQIKDLEKREKRQSETLRETQTALKSLRALLAG